MYGFQQNQVVGDMQQKLCTRNASLFAENGQACGSAVLPPLPFRCPRCGERERFRSLASLRAHLEYSHTYRAPHDLSLPTRRGRSLTDAALLPRRAARDMGCAAQTRATSDADAAGGSDPKPKPSADPPPPPDHPPDSGGEPRPPSPERGLCGGDASALVAVEAQVRRRLDGMLRAVDSTMERRLRRLSTELAQTDTELLCERAHSQHLARERQHVYERERALSRQVDAAVVVIATLREQLTVSEHELERKEQEVITIQNFLEAAAQHEICGKVRLRRFIENLLRRIALAERLLEYYQSSPHTPRCTSHHAATSPVENGPHRITKSRSAVDQLVPSGPHEAKLHPPQTGRGYPKPPRERLGHPSPHCRDHRDEVWSQRRRSDGYEV